MNFSSKVRDEFSFVRGNYLILVLSWVARANYVFMAFGMLAGGVIYSFNPQLPFLLLLTAAIPSFLVITFLVHEAEKREAG
jgi:hypothetical protein